MSKQYGMWTQDEVSTLISGYEVGLSRRQISHKLGRSIPSIKRKVTQLGLKHPNHFQYEGTTTVPLTSDWAYLLGLLIGDGCSTDKGLTVSTVDQDWATFLRGKLEHVFGRKPRVRYYMPSMMYANGKSYACQAYWKIDLNHAGIGRTLMDRTKTKTWRVPDEIWVANDYYKGEFLKAYFDSDGSVTPANYSVTVTSCNKSGLLEIQKLLGIFGIRSTLGPNHDSYEIGIHHIDNFLRFAEYVGFAIKRKQERLMKMIKQNLAPPTRCWTHADEEFLARDYARGDVDLLACLLGRSKLAVRHKASRMNLRSVRRWTREEMKKLKKLYVDGASVEMISERLGRTVYAIYSKTHKLNMTHRHMSGVLA